MEPVELKYNNELWVVVSLHIQGLIVCTAGVAMRDRMREKQKEKRIQQHGARLMGAGWNQQLVGGGGFALVA